MISLFSGLIESFIPVSLREESEVKDDEDEDEDEDKKDDDSKDRDSSENNKKRKKKFPSETEQMTAMRKFCEDIEPGIMEDVLWQAMTKIIKLNDAPWPEELKVGKTFKIL